MTRDVADYVALAIIQAGEKGPDPFTEDGGDFSGDLAQLKDHAETICRFELSETILKRVMRNLAVCGLVRVTDDPYSGTYIKIKSTEFGRFIKEANEEFARARKVSGVEDVFVNPSDYPLASALASRELFEDYHELGSPWLNKALEGLRAQISEKGSLEALQNQVSNSAVVEAPASDRTVTLAHNQQILLEDASSELIDLVEKENAVDGDSGLRQRIVGELKAGRELIRAQSVRAFLLYTTLVSALGALIEKYGGTAIGLTAKKLLDLLIEHVFKS